jgi:3-oxoadipate enol-lactonase
MSSTEPFDCFAGRTSYDLGQKLSTGEVVLWHHDDGRAAEPMVLVGGFTAGHFAFDFVRPYLAGYRLITWEPRGLGPSWSPDQDPLLYSAETWASDLYDVLRALDLDRVHLWAGGFGSYCAFRFAADHPDMLGALVAYSDVWAGDSAKAYDRIYGVYKAIVDNFGTTGFGARVLANVFDVSGLPWFGAWEARNIEEVLHPETVDATVGYGCLRADVRDALTRITIPTLILQGSRSWDGEALDPAEDASLRLILDSVPDVEVAVVPDAHPAYVLVQKPEECGRVVQDFLARHPLADNAAAPPQAGGREA